MYISWFCRIACKSGSKIDIYEDDVKLTTIQPTATASADFDHWQTQSFPLSLTAGKHRLKLYSAARLFYYEWLSVGAPQGIDQLPLQGDGGSASKLLRSGQLIIRSNGQEYNAQGALII